MSLAEKVADLEDKYARKSEGYALQYKAISALQAEVACLRAELRSTGLTDEQISNIVRIGTEKCGHCGGARDKPGMMSDDSYSTFECPYAFHRDPTQLS